MRLFIVFFFFIIRIDSIAQSTLIYEGAYSVKPGVNGMAAFEYEPGREGTRIKSGSFLFNAAESDSMSMSSFRELTWEGRYRENEKNGEWRYHHLTHYFQVLDVQDYKPIYHLDTHQEFIRGVYDQGEPHGPWSLKTELISNHQDNKVISRAEATFKKAKLDNNLYFEEDEAQVTITGRAEDGIMVGAWQFDYTAEGRQITESRHYRKGFLSSLTKISADGDTLISLEYPLSSEILAYLDSGQNQNVINAPVSLHFSDGYPRNSSYIVEQDQANSYLNKLMKYLMRHDVDFAEKYGLPLGANRMYYPLSSAEKVLEENWVQVFYDYRSKIHQLQELSSQNGIFEQEDTIRIINHWVKDQEELIRYITPWDNIIMKNEMGYYNREGMLKQYVEDILSSDSLTLTNQNQVVTYRRYPGEEESFLFFLDHNIKERTFLADSFLTIYKRKNRIHREFVQLLEEKREIISEKAVVQGLLRKKTGDRDVDAVLDHLDKHILESLTEAFMVSAGDSALSMSELKMNGKIVREKLSLLKETEATLRNVARFKELLEEMYTAYRFDPFTYSENVPYKEYPQLYDVFALKMVADKLREAQKDFTVAGIHSNVHLAMRIQERLTFLADKDETLRRIEKRLNKRQSEKEKLDLLKP